jgi:hypothetical protein
MTALRASAALLVLGLVAGTSACGDDAAPPSAATATSAAPTPEPTPTTNGIDTLPPEKALAAAKAAFLKASTVRIRGRVPDDEKPLTIDLRLASNGDADAKVTQGRETMRVLIIGDDVWISGNRAFLTEIGGPKAYSRLRGRYVHGTRDSRYAKDLLRLVDRRSFADEVLPAGDGRPDGQEPANGVPARRFTDPERASVYLVALVGEPYPLRLADAADTEDSRLEFLEYGKPLNLEPPPASKVVEIP